MQGIKLFSGIDEIIQLCVLVFLQKPINDWKKNPLWQRSLHVHVPQFFDCIIHPPQLFWLSKYLEDSINKKACLASNFCKRMMSKPNKYYLSALQNKSN